jgi:hypothetical protein
MVVNQSHEAETCEQFQRQLADLIARDTDLYSHPHLQHCETCCRLIVDLERIAEAARRALPND